jgi:hypothetical protein
MYSLSVKKGNPVSKAKIRNSKKSISLIALFFLFLFSINASAQCAMCRAALSSEGNKVKAEAVNDGIVYLMVIPYILVGGIGYAIYRMKKSKK